MGVEDVRLRNASTPSLALPCKGEGMQLSVYDTVRLELIFDLHPDTWLGAAWLAPISHAV